MKNKFQPLFFMTFLTCGSFSLFASNIIMTLYPNCGYLILLILLPLNLLLGFIIAKRNFMIKDVLQSKFLRILLIIYIFIFSFLSFFSFLGVIQDYYYPLTNKLIIFLIIAIACHFFSEYGVNNLIKMGFVIGIITLFLYILTLTSETKHDFYLLNHTNTKIEKPFYLFSFIFVFLDGYITSTFSPNIKMSKSLSSLYILLSSAITILFILENYLFFPFSYFLETKYPYLLRYYAYKNTNFLEHLDILYLFCTTIFIIFHYAIHLEIFRITIKAKRKSKKPLILTISILLTYYFTKTLFINTNIIVNSMFFMSAILIIFFTILLIKKKVKKNA